MSLTARVGRDVHPLPQERREFGGWRGRHAAQQPPWAPHAHATVVERMLAQRTQPLVLRPGEAAATGGDR